jgi:hypothetical protein
LPDGNVNTSEPTQGCILGTIAPGRENEYGIRDGRLVDLASTAVIYFTLQLPDTTDKVQHMWAVFDTPSDVSGAEQGGLNISSPERDWGIPGGPNQAGIHWNYIGYYQRWDVGPYNCPGTVNFSTAATIAAGTNVLTVTATSGTIVIGSSLIGLTGGTFIAPWGTPLITSSRGTPLITSQLTGTAGGVGTYSLSLTNTAGTGATATGANNVEGGPSATGRISAGRTVRLDVVLDRASGAAYGFFNGVLAVHYPASAALQYTSAIGWFEFAGTKTAISECGISAHLPYFYTNGAPKLTYMTNSDFLGVSTITTTWQLVATFNVSFGESEYITIEWNPLINIPNGVTVYLDIGTTTQNPDQINVTSKSDNYSRYVLGSGPINSRIPYLTATYGFSGTTQKIGIWTKTNTGTATLAGNTNGVSGGIRWRPASNAMAIGAYDSTGAVVGAS